MQITLKLTTLEKDALKHADTLYAQVKRAIIDDIMSSLYKTSTSYNAEATYAEFERLMDAIFSSLPVALGKTLADIVVTRSCQNDVPPSIVIADLFNLS